MERVKSDLSKVKRELAKKGNVSIRNASISSKAKLAVNRDALIEELENEDD